MVIAKEKGASTFVEHEPVPLDIIDQVPRACALRGKRVVSGDDDVSVAQDGSITFTILPVIFDRCQCL
jgi:hypothetical protein